MAALKDKVNSRPLRIGFVGSSHARRICKIERKARRLVGFPNKIAFFGRGGITARHLNEDSGYMDEAIHADTDIAILFCGSNDVDNQYALRIGGRMFAQRILDNWYYLDSREVITFAFGIGERYRVQHITQKQYHTLSNTINTHLAKWLPEGRYLNFRARHQDLYFDGVHCTDEGYISLLDLINERINALLAQNVGDENENLPPINLDVGDFVDDNPEPVLEYIDYNPQPAIQYD